ncbi:MAG: HEAT repeat domain-containing protein [Symploca sp. SIO1B1]|nr:HEAT repeat domain-containing protein [Symploca sp. SIO1B1]
MSSQINFTLSLLTILTFLANQTPVAAQKETLNSQTAVVAMLKKQENTKPIIVADLVEQLRTTDAEERRQIIKQLSDTKQDIVPALVKAMDDPDPLVKSAVAEVLGNLTDDAAPAIPGLIEMLNDRRRAIVPEPSSRQFLPRLTIPPAPPSIFLTPTPNNVNQRRLPPNPPKNPENLLRITAIIALGKIGLPARALATPPLTKALEDSDPWVKLNATWALSQIGASVSLLSHWLEALHHSNANLRHSAAEVFQDSSSLLPKVLGAEADNNTAASLVKALKDDNVVVRRTASKALSLLGTEVLPGLIKALKEPEPIVRLEIVELLGNLEGAAQSAVPDILPLLEDKERYVPPSSNQYPLTPTRLALVLPRAQPYYWVPNNPEQLVRVNAAIALGKLSDRSAIPALTTALKDNNPWMQLATGWALLRLGNTQGLPVVGPLVKYPNESVQRAALYQLRGYGPGAAPYILPYYASRLDSNDDNERNGAIIQIGKFGAASLGLVPKLRTLLVSNKKNSPGYAATILGEIARDTAIAWQNGNISPSQRQQAIADFTQVLAIMQAPNARFNREPVERVRNGLATLRGITQ